MHGFALGGGYWPRARHGEAGGVLFEGTVAAAFDCADGHEGCDRDVQEVLVARL